MLEGFIITLREGIEAALVVAILLSYLNRSAQERLKPAVYWGTAVAIVFSLIGGVLLARLPFNEEAYEGVLYLVAAIFVGTMLLWMHRHGKHLKSEIENKVGSLTGSDSNSSSLSWRGLLLFLFTFLMIFREGAETVLFYTAATLNSNTVFSIVGALLGIIVAVVFCVALVRGTLRVNLRHFFQVTTIILAVLIVQLLINGYHELSEAGWIAATKTTMAVVGPVVRNNSLFILAILVIPLGYFLHHSSPLSEKKPSENLSTPGLRKLLAEQKRIRAARRMAFLTIAATFVLVGYDYLHSSRLPDQPDPTSLEINDGKVMIPLSTLEKGKMRMFQVNLEGVPVRFFIVDTSSGIKTVFDACTICGTVGYTQIGSEVICRNCTAGIYIPSLGQSGGCNPIPLPHRIQDGNIVIDTDVLHTHKETFSE